MEYEKSDVRAIEILTAEDLVKEIVVVEQLIKTADNVILLLDSSDSMGKEYLNTNMSRYDAINKVLKERNAYFPDLGYNFGLYLYGGWSAVYPVQPYNREKFAAALDSLPDKPKGATNLQWGLRKLDTVLKGLSGTSVVFITSDGTFSETDEKRPARIAKELAAKYNVCFCVVSTADDTASREVNKKVAAVSPCSLTIPLSRFVDRPEYNSGMLYVVAATLDVITTTETRIVGAKVDNILFDYDSFDIRREFDPALDKLGRFMQQNPNTYAVLAGYSCNFGDQKYNLGLSRFRVRSVAQYLENSFNISADRLVTLWYGELNPVSDNSTKDGRRMNRRVEIAVGGP